MRTAGTARTEAGGWVSLERRREGRSPSLIQWCRAERSACRAMGPMAEAYARRAWRQGERRPTGSSASSKVRRAASRAALALETEGLVEAA